MTHARARTERGGPRRLTIVLQGLLLVGLILEAWTGHWLGALATAGILTVTLLPIVLQRRFDVHIPADFHALAVVFAFATLFLGEVRNYYVRFAWWDLVAHGASAFLLAILGFLLGYILNEHRGIEFHAKPGFVALFAFMFSLGIGALWEIFEFAMDNLLGVNMQKSGLVDTMWDLIVDAGAALVMAVLGYRRLRTIEIDSFLERWLLRALAATRDVAPRPPAA